MLIIYLRCYYETLVLNVSRKRHRETFFFFGGMRNIWYDTRKPNVLICSAIGNIRHCIDAIITTTPISCPLMYTGTVNEFQFLRVACTYSIEIADALRISNAFNNWSTMKCIKYGIKDIRCFDGVAVWQNIRFFQYRRHGISM